MEYKQFQPEGRNQQNVKKLTELLTIGKSRLFKGVKLSIRMLVNVYRLTIPRIYTYIRRIVRNRHNWLSAHWQRYASFSQKPYFRKIMTSVTSLALIVCCVGIYHVVHASPDITDTWTFLTGGAYTVDNGAEISNGTAHLKAQNYSADANTLALYHFDQTTGTSVTDSSTNGNTGTVHGTANWLIGNLNNALSLDGSTNDVTVPSSSANSLAGTNTIEAWTKLNSSFSASSSQDQTIVDKGGYKLYYNHTTGKLTYRLATTGATTHTEAASAAGINAAFSGPQNKVTAQSVTPAGDVIFGVTGDTGGTIWYWNHTTNAVTQIGAQAGFVAGGNGNVAVTGITTIDATTAGIIWAGIAQQNGQFQMVECSFSGGVCSSSGTWYNVYSNSYAFTGSAANGNEFMDAHGQYSGVTCYDSCFLTPQTYGAAGNPYTGYAMDSGNDLWTTQGGGTNGKAEVYENAYLKVGGEGLNGSWSSSFTIAKGITCIGSNCYVGVGQDNGSDAQVWFWNHSTSTWTKIGDKSNFAGNNFQHITSITNDGTNIYVGVLQNSGGYDYGAVYKYNGTSWSAVAGTWDGSAPYNLSYSNSNLYVTSSLNGQIETQRNNGTTWTSTSFTASTTKALTGVTASTNYNGKLYSAVGVASGDPQVWQNNAGTWTKVGGDGLNGSWSTNSNIQSMVVYNGNLEVGLYASGVGEVWQYNGTIWTKIAGGGVNSSWSSSNGVYSLMVYGNNLYAGLGGGTSDPLLYQYNGTSWSQAHSFIGSSIQNIDSLTVYNGKLYIGIGGASALGVVYSYDGTTFTAVASSGSNGWPSSALRHVSSLTVYNNSLYAGTSGDAGNPYNAVWQYNGTTWTRIADGGLNSSWATNTYTGVSALTTYRGYLYAATTGTAGNGTVWQYDGTNWSKTGGNGVNGSWDNGVTTITAVNTLTAYNGSLFEGMGNTASTAQLWYYNTGSDYVLSATPTGQDTNWHHVAATYDGTTMKLYIDGVQQGSLAATGAIQTNGAPLTIGSSLGSDAAGATPGLFNGQLDELRISNIARTSFTTVPYLNTPQAITLTNAVHTSGVWQWNGLTDVETPNGGTVTYRFSVDNGNSWLYWNGSGWVASSGYGQANDVATVNTHLATLPVTFSGIKWQAVLQGSGTQNPTLTSLTETASSDVILPSTNASAITATKVNGGASLAANGWTNGGAPDFSWTAGNDAQSGVKGYCAYIGADSTADPVVSKGLLGTSPIATGSHCQYIVAGTNLDLGIAGVLASPLTSSTQPYYLTLKAIDNAGNVINSAQQFSFRFDNTPPTLPTYITGPSGFVNSKDIRLTWPTTGSSAPTDSTSGIIGLQYRINNGSWYGANHTGTGDINDLLPNSGEYTTVPTPDYDDLNEGPNTISFRVWDTAGNISTGYVSATLKINTTGAPSLPLNLAVTPATSTSNSFAFNWTPPQTFIGDVNNITYCYTINILPSSTSCTWTPAGATSLAAGPYATQPGDNQFYIVARDESGNVSYGSYATTDFTANTPAPGIPLNGNVSDVSIKATQNWRLAITWDIPSSVGSGVSSYRISRSTDNQHFSVVGSSSGTSYIDTNLTQQTYYYKLNACDSANNCSADSTVMDGFPSGKFTSPAALTGQPSISAVTTRSATVSWSTDRTSDSKVASGVESGSYSPSEIAVADQVTSHVVQMSNLTAGTTYYIQAQWTDEDGNTGKSQEVTFTTLPAPTVKEVQATKITVSSATIGFTSRDATKVALYYGPTDSFGAVKMLNTATLESTYDMTLDGLTDGVKYYYKLVSYDVENNTYDGNIYSFTTPARPHITNLTFQPISGTPTSTQQINWTTNVPTDSTITYGIVGSKGQDIYDPTMTTTHSITVNGLQDNSEYFLVAQSRDVDGNVAQSDQLQFHTALDTRPPVISNVQVESSIKGTGAQASGQVIISWNTDEPATSQVAYGPGGESTSLRSKTPEDASYSSQHVVVVSNLPTSQVYTLQPLSKDHAANQAYGIKQTTIVGHASDSVLTIVLSSIRKVFGF